MKKKSRKLMQLLVAALLVLTCVGGVKPLRAEAAGTITPYFGKTNNAASSIKSYTDYVGSVDDGSATRLWLVFNYTPSTPSNYAGYSYAYLTVKRNGSIYQKQDNVLYTAAGFSSGKSSIPFDFTQGGEYVVTLTLKPMTTSNTAAASAYWKTGTATIEYYRGKTPTQKFASSSLIKTYSTTTFTNTFTTNSDGAKTYKSSNTSVATVNSSTGAVTMVGAGTTTISVSTAETYNYEWAGGSDAGTSYTLKVNKATPTVKFSSSSVSKTCGDAAFTITPTTSSNGTKTYKSSKESVATVDSKGQVTIKGVGTTTITCTTASTTKYNAASGSYTLTVSKGTPTLTFASSSVSKAYGDGKFTNALTKKTDGAVTYKSSNTNVATVGSSTGEVTIKGVGSATITATAASTSNYNSGTKTYTVTVSKGTPTLTFKSATVSKTYGASAFTNTLTKKTDGTVTYTSSNTKVATVDSKGKVTIKGAGTANITATAAAGTKYKSGTKSYALTVKKASPKTVTLSKTAYTYDGKAKKPGVTVTNSAGKTLKKDTDYTVKYPDGRKSVGKYTVTVKMKGNYTGTKKVSFTIKPPKTSISSLKAGSAGSKKFTVKWSKKTTQVTGYQIQYSTSSKFSSTKSVKVNSNSTTSKSVTGLTKGKKYYVRIRTYKTVDGTTYYSAWSSAKSVTVK